MDRSVELERLRRVAVLVMLTAIGAGAAALLATKQTPAAPREVEIIRPYDPLP